MAARRRRGCRSMCRRSIAISMSSPATRLTARPASACSRRKTAIARGDAALPGRRRHDPQRHVREDDCSRSRRRGSRPARPISPARSASRRALDYIEQLGRDAIAAHEAALTGYGIDQLSRLPGVAAGAGGAAALRHPVVRRSTAFTRTIWRQLLDQHEVAVRAGHHCAQPLMDKLGLAATTRASFGVYNDESDIDALAAAIEAAQNDVHAAEADHGLARALSGHHSRSRPPPAEFPQAGASEPFRARPQPAVRRPRHGLSSSSTATRSRM